VQTRGGQWLAVDPKREVLTTEQLIAAIAWFKNYRRQRIEEVTQLDERIRQAEEVLAFIEGQAP
jgi:hypothetical protein